MRKKKIIILPLRLKNLKSKELKPCKSLPKAGKGNGVTAVESIILKTFFPYTSSSAKGVLLFSKSLESVFSEERKVWFSNRKLLNAIYGNEHQEL